MTFVKKVVALVFIMMCELSCMGLAQATVKQFRITPTIGTGAYEALDQVGGLQTLTAAAIGADSTAKLTTLVVIDKDAEGAALRLLFFSEAPTLTSVDSAVLAVTDAELASKLLGAVELAGDDYVTVAGAKVAALGNVDLDLISTALDTTLRKNKNLYVVVQMVGTPTYTAASDLVFLYTLED